MAGKYTCLYGLVRFPVSNKVLHAIPSFTRCLATHPIRDIEDMYAGKQTPQDDVPSAREKRNMS